MKPIKVHALKGLRLFEMRLHVEGRFPVKFLAFVHMCPRRESSCLAPVIQRVDNAIHQINLYPVDSAIRFVKSLSAG